MNNTEIIEFLKKIELFRGLTEDEFQMLFSSVKQKTFNPNDTLFRENDPRESIFIIYDGAVELFKSNTHGTELKRFLLQLDKHHLLIARGLHDCLGGKIHIALSHILKAQELCWQLLHLHSY